MTRGELGARMTSAEFSGWLAYETLYGIPDNVSLALQIFRTVFAAAGSKPVKVGDLIPYFKPQIRARQTDADMLAVMRRVAAAQDAKGGRRGKG